MTLTYVVHCDKPECDGHQSYIRERSMPPEWVEVHWWGLEGAKVLHFCSWDCVLAYAGTQPPVLTIPFDEGLGKFGPG